MKRIFLTTLAVAAAFALGASPAHAETSVPDVAPEIAQALEVVPGGVVIDYWTAEWPDQDMRLEAPRAADELSGLSTFAARSVGSCATGRICAYSGYGVSGASLSWSTCSTHSTAAIGTVRSIANARSSGTMYARNGGALVASTSAGSWKNVYGAVTTVNC